MHLISNEKKKTISTQTIFNKARNSSIDLIVNSISMISKSRDLLKSFKETSELDISNVSISLSSIESVEIDSNPIEEYQFNDYSSKPSSTNCGIYIRSIGRQMLSDEESYLDIE
jgi:hypothetical protein